MEPARSLTLLACVSLLMATGCTRGTGSPAEPAAQAENRTVAVAQVQEIATIDTVYATGTLAAFDRAVISTKVPGRLESLSADLGTLVKKRDTLAQMEQTDYELRRRQSMAALAQARSRLGLSLTGEQDKANPENTSIAREAFAVLEEAAKNRERILSLHRQGIIAEAEVETANSSFLVATNRYQASLDEARTRLALLAERQADLAIAEQQLADTTLTAPFDGVIERRQASPGEYLQPGAPILTLVRVDPVRLRAEVPERHAPKISTGQKVILQLEGSSLLRTGIVSRLSPVISPENRMLLVEADFRNPDGLLRPGSFAKAEIVVNDSRRAPFVPESAIVTFAGIQKVFTVNEGKAVEKEIAAGQRRGPNVEITKGITPGELVVLEPGNLRDGQPVQIAGQES